MFVSGVTSTAPIIGTRSPFPAKGQEQTQLHVVPVAKNYITKEKPQQALEEAVKTLSPASETVVTSEEETSSFSPSATIAPLPLSSYPEPRLKISYAITEGSL